MDRKLQYPEGARVFENLTMEYASGCVYRIVRRFCPQLPYHVFLT